MVELRDLRSFQAVATDLHFGRAAERVGVSQPTLSRHIRRLEDELGVVLLHRTSRRVGLTDAGRSLATTLPAALRQLDRALAEARSGESGGWEV
ncbi:LysR family transcriptional regulator [Capillimicrobium parvum]|uniref:Hydrogen peroxide-inducible genes activator n=1 Tax=Capillimicrobium parvum TaxID=2884022 RepID=A0A9E7C2U9_9ACTN|nr:Hydrogen peroxide-inducible genes activator [Capillimicrobium parvum]